MPEPVLQPSASPLACASSPASTGLLPLRRCRRPTRRSSWRRSTTRAATRSRTSSRGRGHTAAARCCGRRGSRSSAGGRACSRPHRSGDVGERELAAILTVEGDAPSRLDERARLWRDAAELLIEDYAGSAEELIAASEGMLGGPSGLLARLAAIEAFSDPLAKKSFLVAKIWERRGWLAVADPASWEVSADSVLMRLALRAGLVHPAEDVETVREATRDMFRVVSELSEVPPPAARRPALGARPRRPRPDRHGRRRPARAPAAGGRALLLRRAGSRRPAPGGARTRTRRSPPASHRPSAIR